MLRPGKRRIVQAPDSVNLNRCQACGTTNPSLPGSGLPAMCDGCGASLPGQEMTVTAADFTPPKRPKDQDPRHHRKANRDADRISGVQRQAFEHIRTKAPMVEITITGSPSGNGSGRKNRKSQRHR